MDNQEPTPKEERIDEGSQREDQPTQKELQQRYLEQQRRMRCIGCGEGEEYF